MVVCRLISVEDELKSYIGEIASNIKDEIKKNLKGRHFCILMDIGSKNNKALLGISCQTMIDDEIVIYSLGVIPLDSSHTAGYIKEKLTNCLEHFDLPCKFVVSITTDNAKNMLATTNNFDAHLKEANWITRTTFHPSPMDNKHQHQPSMKLTIF